jgi:hypothetical protein
MQECMSQYPTIYGGTDEKEESPLGTSEQLVKEETIAPKNDENLTEKSTAAS